MFAVFWNKPHALKINAMPCSWAQLNAIVLTQLSGISAYLNPQAPPLGQVFPILCLVEMPMLGLFPADTGPYNGANTKEFQRHHIKIRVFCKQRMLFGQISAWIMGSLLSFAEFQTFQLLYPVPTTPVCLNLAHFTFHPWYRFWISAYCLPLASLSTHSKLLSSKSSGPA